MTNAIAIEEMADLQKWIEKQAQTYQLTYLLAHADDGVIWGRFDQGRLITADHVFPKLPKLRLSTLQQCRIFGEAGEVLLWRSQNNWKARLITDPDCEYISENQMLWGTHPIEEKEGFTLVEDGSEGLRHAIPLPRKDIPFSSDSLRDGKAERPKLDRPLRLNVRHYIDYDEAGVARISLSRLVNISVTRSQAE
ncbi:MAG: CRISPR-associated protein Csx19 [Leptolyngbyaceae bacterium]|nr:CRISPR-associated protein Csx19 [Leptolyngbyaceae bacterium]